MAIEPMIIGTGKDAVIVKQFDRTKPDAFGELERLVKDKWEDYYKHLVDDYTTEYLKWCLMLFMNPDFNSGRLHLGLGEVNHSFSVGAYDKDQLVGFLGALPMKVLINQKLFEANIVSFLTLNRSVGRHLSDKKQRLAYRQLVLDEMFDFYLREFHYGGDDRVTFYFIDRPRKMEEGKNYAAKLLDDYLDRRSNVIVREKEIPIHLGRAVFNPEKVRECFPGWDESGVKQLDAQDNVRSFTQNDFGQCQKLVVEGIFSKAAIARGWDFARSYWQMSVPPAYTLVMEYDGQILGFINYHVKNYLGPQAKSRPELKCGFIDSICIDPNMTDVQLQELVNGTFYDMIKRGCDFASIPSCSYLQNRSSKGNDKVSHALQNAGAVLDNVFVFRMGILRSPYMKALNIPKKGKVYMDVK